MKIVPLKPHGRLLAILMSLLLLAAGGMPLDAQAVKYISLGGGGGTNATEGDPLDANDYSSGSNGGGLIDDNIHEVPFIEPVSDNIGVFQLPVGRLKLLMALDLRTGMPVFRIITFRDFRTRPEARDER